MNLEQPGNPEKPYVSSLSALPHKPGDTTGFSRRGFADQLSIDTPEQVALEFPVAGIGSRFVALLLDHLIQFAVVVGVLVLLAMVDAATRNSVVRNLASKWFIAGVIFAFFLLFWGYFSLFEAFWRGQTPGKRAMHLRVLKDAGRQITLFESLTRNLLRLIDYLPSLYLAGFITMLANKENKRLGDLAAGTVVVHERPGVQPLLIESAARGSSFAPSPFAPPPFATPPLRPAALPASSPPPSLFPADALAKLGSRELIVLDAFFARALDLPLEVRAAMAYQIVGEFTARMGVEAPEGNPERIMEAMAIGLRRTARRF